MSDNITLPREVAEHLMWVLEESQHYGGWSERENVTLAAVRKALAAEQPKQNPEPEFIKDLLTVTLRVVRGDRVFKVERWLHLSSIKQSNIQLVGIEADRAWQELDAAMGDKT